MKGNVITEAWGTIDGRAVCLYTMKGENGMEVTVSNFGALIRSIRVPDRNGVLTDCVLGYDTVEEYKECDTYFGMCIGPIADRLKGARYTHGGEVVEMDRNAGEDCVHSGRHGFDRVIWEARPVENGMEFTRVFTPGIDLDLPANIVARVRYELKGNALSLDWKVTADREVPLSVTNHSYFNLTGSAENARGHIVYCPAEYVVSTDNAPEPSSTEELLPLEGTPMDLRWKKTIGEAVAHEEFDEIRKMGGIDHFYPVDGEGMRTHGMLYSERSGIRLTVRSDAPGVFIYMGNNLTGAPGKNGIPYERNMGCCFETENYPNGVNLPSKKESVMYGPERDLVTRTILEFTVETE